MTARSFYAILVKVEIIVGCIMSKNLYISALLDVYGDFLGEKPKAFLEYYYNDDLSLSEIAENEGITRQGAHDQIKRAEAKLLEWEEKCRYCEKILKLKELSQNDENFTEIKKIINDL